MAEVFKVLGQSIPGSGATTDLYTVPAATSATISTLTVCNRSATATSFRVSVAVGGAVNSNVQFLYYDQAIDGNSTYAITLGMTLAATDVLRTYSTLSTLTFCAFGVEVS